jgi:pyruvate/2-oxoglutarate dehydrogenase complex dihydrolipoamide acyltransferase (E2) component
VQRNLFLPAERRPTYYFLQYAKRFSQVYVSTELDMGLVRAHRGGVLAATGRRFSYVSYVIRSVALALGRYPEANASVLYGFFPRFMRHTHIHAKFTVDKSADGRRFVAAGLVLDADRAELAEIQARIDYVRDSAFDKLDEFRNARLLRKLPLGIGQWVYNAALSSLERRGRLQGTFTVTSLGHRPIREFFPVSSSTLCFGMGAIEPRAVVVNGQVVIREMMTLGFAFDHAVLDGGLAADLLTEIKRVVESGEWNACPSLEAETVKRLSAPAEGSEERGDDE